MNWIESETLENEWCLDIDFTVGLSLYHNGDYSAYHYILTNDASIKKLKSKNLEDAKTEAFEYIKSELQWRLEKLETALNKLELTNQTTQLSHNNSQQP